MSFQKCPICEGSGVVPLNTYNINATQDVCDICQGKKIISSLTGRPPGDVRCVSGTSKQTKEGNKELGRDFGKLINKFKCFDFYKYVEKGYRKVGDAWEIRSKMPRVEQRLKLQDIYDLWVDSLKKEQ